jgi:hypothetical protein
VLPIGLVTKGAMSAAGLAALLGGAWAVKRHNRANLRRLQKEVSDAKTSPDGDGAPGTLFLFTLGHSGVNFAYSRTEPVVQFIRKQGDKTESMAIPVSALRTAAAGILISAAFSAFELPAPTPDQIAQYRSEVEKVITVDT